MSRCSQFSEQKVLTTQTHLVAEAAGCVKSHAGIKSARAFDAAVPLMFDNVHNLSHRVLLHLTAHVHLKVRLPCDLSRAGGVGTNCVCVHNPAVVELVKVEENEN